VADSQIELISVTLKL